MTIQEIHQLVIGLPNDSKHAGIKSAYAEKRFADCSMLLAAVKKDGVVPTAELNFYAIKIGLVGKLSVVIAKGLTEASSQQSQNLFGLCSNILAMLNQPIPVPVDDSVFQAGLAVLLSENFVTQEQVDYISAMKENRQPVLVVSAEQLESAYKFGEL